MKIVYVITRSDVMGGASVHLLDLAFGAQLVGHDVTILVGGNGIVNSRAKEKGISCFSLDYLTREIHFLKEFRGLMELRAYLLKLKPDIVHLHSSKAGMLGRLAAKSASVPAVFTVHGWAFTEGVSRGRRFLYRLIEKVIAPLANRIITVSDYDRNLALGLKVCSAERMVTIHNGVPDIDRINSSSSADTTVRLIMVARFAEPKEHSELLHSMSKLESLNWSLEFVGDGPELNKSKRLCESLGINDRVLFSGARNDVDLRLADADIFVLISRWEGFPLTIIEAMRAGIPVVASSVGGVPEAVEDGVVGFLIKSNSVDEIASRLEELILSKGLREKMGAAARESYEANFTFEKMLNKTLDLYDEVITGRRI